MDTIQCSRTVWGVRGFLARVPRLLKFGKVSHNGLSARLANVALLHGHGSLAALRVTDVTCSPKGNNAPRARLEPGFRPRALLGRVCGVCRAWLGSRSKRCCAVCELLAERRED